MKSKRTLKIISAVLAAVIVIFAGASAYIKEKHRAEESFIAMGTVFTLNIYGKNAEEALSEIKKETMFIETDELSKNSEVSLVSELNEKGEADLSGDIFGLFELSQNVSRDSGGAYDITVGALTELWNIGSDRARVPSQAEIDEALKTVDFKKITLENGKAVRGEGQKIDPGAVGKGYVCDKAEEILKKHSVKSAVISAGGSILIYGDNPDGGDWKVGIRNPKGSSSELFAVLSLKGGYISTSGDYERTFTKDGKTYHHILDPKTGYPAKSEFSAVTVISNSGALSDALSTACFVLGYEKSLPLLGKYGAEAVFVRKDNSVSVTDGLKNALEITNDSFTLK